MKRYKILSIPSDKIEEMVYYAEEMFRNGAHLMDCISGCHDEDAPHFRDGMNEGEGWDGREGWDSGSGRVYQRDGMSEGGSFSQRIESMIHQRRGVKGTGRYSRY